MLQSANLRDSIKHFCVVRLKIQTSVTLFDDGVHSILIWRHNESFKRLCVKLR